MLITGITQFASFDLKKHTKTHNHKYDERKMKTLARIKRTQRMLPLSDKYTKEAEENDGK